MPASSIPIVTRVFICEPAHRDWISPAPGERVFVIEQPFNPFGRRAAELRKDLESSPIEACALIIAGVGLESLRFRVFALRLRTQRFRLLGGDARNDSKQLDRLSFALLTGVTLPLGRLRKIEGKVRAHVGRIAALLREPRDLVPRGYGLGSEASGPDSGHIMAGLRAFQGWILAAYKSITVWLRGLQDQISALMIPMLGVGFGTFRKLMTAPAKSYPR